MSTPPQKKTKRHERHDPSAYEQLFKLIQTRPFSTALGILGRLRTGTDAQSVVRHVNVGDLLIQLSLQPNMQYRYTLPYSTDLGPLFNHPHNPYTRSRLFQLTFEDLTVTKTPASHEPNIAEAHRRRIYEVPYHVARVVDPRISVAVQHLHKWTCVTHDHILLQKLLEIYFQHEYSCYQFFHKDTFLDDLVAERHESCSSLLVNSILASACHTIATTKNPIESTDPKTYGFLFLAESKKLWDLEAGIPKLTTIQASLVIGMSFSQNAMGKVGSIYWSHAISMAEEMRLFTKPDPSLDERSQTARIVTAWSLFNLEATRSFFYLRPPVVSTPPEAALPSPDKISQWFGDMWLLYPCSRVLVPACLGFTFLAFCELHLITNEIAQQCRQSSADTPMPLHVASKLYKRLRKWWNNLPAPLQPQFAVLPVHLLLHMLYNTILHRTFSSLQSAEMAFDSPSSMLIDYLGYSPTQIVRNAQTCLETLLHIFYRLHGSDSWCGFLMNMLSHVAFDALDGVSDQNKSAQTRNVTEINALRATLKLCSREMKKQGRNNSQAEILFLLLIDRMKSEDVALLIDGAELLHQRNTRASYRKVHKGHMDLHIGTDFATVEGETKSLDHLAEALQDVDIMETQ